jgi:hypothetical protein
MAVLVATTGLMSTPGVAGATVAAHPVERVDAGTAGPERRAFFERYRGHHIMGWGRDESACAYIDGVQLVLYPVGDDRYLSAVQAFQEERGVRGITRASVRALGGSQLAPPEPSVAHCPVFRD